MGEQSGNPLSESGSFRSHSEYGLKLSSGNQENYAQKSEIKLTGRALIHYYLKDFLI